ncbi:hypothetical protein POM88_034281 [Heracleum sosnowskyi]|uniref:Uncharacterized protein n=1 Tax=Heracleum sosnowskyi TaxID=360622 RepID=A0AAD8HKX8_9APIA|nr:hypothetical protein POM88_034281 [Heracleum sosnowskyi]
MNGLASKGNNVNVTNVDAQLFHYNIVLFYENELPVDGKGINHFHDTFKANLKVRSCTLFPMDERPCPVIGTHKGLLAIILKSPPTRRGTTTSACKGRDGGKASSATPLRSLTPLAPLTSA